MIGSLNHSTLQVLAAIMENDTAEVNCLFLATLAVILGRTLMPRTFIVFFASLKSKIKVKKQPSNEHVIT